MNVFGSLSYTRCMTCNFVYTQPYVSGDALTGFYEKIYYSEGGFQKKPASPLDDYTTEPRGLSQFLLLSAYSNLKEKPSLKILDVGPGPGYNLPCAKQVFLRSKINFYAFEPSENSIPILQAYGVAVIPSVFTPESSGALGEEKFDIIILSHVIDACNANDVKNVIGALRDMLKAPESRLLIEVPNMDLSHPSMFRKYNVPHLSFFTDQSMKTMARECGLSVCFVGSCGIPISVAHMLDDVSMADAREDGAIRSLTGRFWSQTVPGIAGRILPRWSKNWLRPVSNIIWKQEEKPRPNQPWGTYFVYRPDGCYLRAVLAKG
jgi:hypothetical protein